MKGVRRWLLQTTGQAARFLTHHLALRWRLMLLLTLLIVVTISALGLITFHIYTDNIVAKTIARKHEMGASVLEAIGIIRERDDYSANQIVRNDDIMEALSYSGPQTPYLRFLEIRACSKALMELVDKSNIVGLAVLGENGKSFYSKSETQRTNDATLRKLTNIPAVAQSHGESIWIPSKSDIFSANDDSPASLYVVKRLYSIRNTTDKSVGLSITQVQYSRLYDILSRITGDEIYSLLADRQGVILCSTKDQSMVASRLSAAIAEKVTDPRQGSFTLKEQGRPLLYLYNRDERSGWMLVQAVPYTLIQSAADEVRFWTLLVASFCLAGALLAAWLFARSFANPVARLEKVMQQFGGGDLTVRSVTDRADEIGRLQQSFNSLAGQVSDLLESMEEEHRQKRMMEIRMMEYQINPHFLYNSLDTINWMASSSGNREIAQMATALAKFFRLGLSRGREIVSVADEVEHARYYLTINRIRYHDGFTYDASVDPEVRECRTVKLILQPLAENALVHAIKKTGAGGHVEIRAYARDDKVVLEVEDNGRGIAAEKLVELRAMLDKKMGDGYDGGIGLMNVQQRVRLYYGAEYGLELESVEGQGALVRIIIPKNYG